MSIFYRKNKNWDFLICSVHRDSVSTDIKREISIRYPYKTIDIIETEVIDSIDSTLQILVKFAIVKNN